MIRTLLKRRQLWILVALILSFFVLKYGYTFFVFRHLPVGYDAGIYRYLFVRFAEGLPPFFIPELPPWTQAHALGLFFFTSVFVKLGVPIDWFVGFLWNGFNIVLPIALALIFTRRNGKTIGILVLLASLLSTVQYEGFVLMYWKTLFALFWCALAFDSHERRSWALVPYGMLTIASHQQIGAIYVVSVVLSLFVQILRNGVRLNTRSFVFILLSIILGALWYLPNYDHAVSAVLKNILTTDAALVLGIFALIVACVMLAWIAAPRHRTIMLLFVAGAVAVPVFLFPITGVAPGIIGNFLRGNIATYPGVFLSIGEYLRLSFPVLILALAGLAFAFQRERGTVWQCAVLVSASAVLSMLFFYRRFILPLDFFLLPFVALGLHSLWGYRAPLLRFLIVIMVVVQAYFLVDRVLRFDPGVRLQDLQELRLLADRVPKGSIMVSMDILAPWLLGMVTDSSVSGPGIFDSQPYDAWQKFFYGTTEDRVRFVRHYRLGTYFYASRFFREYYPPEVQSTVTKNPCFAQEDWSEGLYRSVCDASR